MFHMSREIYDKIEELAGMIANGPEFQAYKAAEAAAAADGQLTALQNSFMAVRKQLDAAIAPEDKDFDLISALTQELDDLSEQMHRLPSWQNLDSARGEYEQLMQGVSDVLQNVIDPDVQCSCRGSCSGCSGCSGCASAE